MRSQPHPLFTSLGPRPCAPLLRSVEGPLSAAANDATQPPVRCGRCGRQHPAARWASLELVDRMSASHVRGLVTVWRMDWTIEIRRCDGCASPIARKQLPT